MWSEKTRHGLLGVVLLAGCSAPIDPSSRHADDHGRTGTHEDAADAGVEPLDELDEEAGDLHSASVVLSDAPVFELGDAYRDPGESEDSWGLSDLNCEADSDCNSFEVCLSGTCQIDRCSAAEYSSRVPLGETFIFFADREFAVADGDAYDGDHFADMYSPAGHSAEYDGSLPAEDGQIRDIAGGDFLGEGWEGYAAVFDNGLRGIARLLSGDEDATVSLAFAPVAADAGDLDGDGRAEIVVIGDSGAQYCDFVDDDCTDIETDAVLVDVTVADVDADGYLEIVFLQQQDGDWFVHIENLDAEITGQAPTATSLVDLAEVERISAGDLDGDGQAEIVVLDDKGFFGTRDDHVLIMALSTTSGEVESIGEFSLDHGRVVDIEVGDMDADGVAELVGLDAYDKLLTFRYDDESLRLLDDQSISLTSDPMYLALADHDDDSPRAELVSGPEVVSGAEVPIVLLYLPPFSYEHSSGFSYSGYGLGETYSETYSDTVSLSINADVGVRAEFLSLFKTSFTEKVAWKTSQTLGSSSSLATGGRSSLRSDPDTFGTHYGAVVVSWGCFHAYTYEVLDPNGHYDDANGEPIVMTVPVDGGTTMLSTTRYNAMAEQVGDLPEMPVPYQVGDPKTYPTSPETIYGEPLDEADQLFPGLTWYEVSDVGYVGWFNQMGESETETTSVGVDLGASANVTVGGVSVGAGFTAGWGNGYTVSRGETALFMGGIPPFVDDPETATDEYVDNFYRVAPIVYTQSYTDSAGNDSQFYVSTYVVDQ